MIDGTFALSVGLSRASGRCGARSFGEHYRRSSTMLAWRHWFTTSIVNRFNFKLLINKIGSEWVSPIFIIFVEGSFSMRDKNFEDVIG